MEHGNLHGGQPLTGCFSFHANLRVSKSTACCLEPVRLRPSSFWSPLATRQSSPGLILTPPLGCKGLNLILSDIHDLGYEIGCGLYDCHSSGCGVAHHNHRSCLVYYPSSVGTEISNHRRASGCDRVGRRAEETSNERGSGADMYRSRPGAPGRAYLAPQSQEPYPHRCHYHRHPYPRHRVLDRRLEPGREF